MVFLSNVYIVVLILRMTDLVAPVAIVVENCSLLLSHRHNISDVLIPPSPISGAMLKYCSKSEKTCCTIALEEKFKEISGSEYERNLKKILLNLSRTLKFKSSKFNEYFKDLLSKSKKDFHEMFKKTYGIVYEQNSYVFSDFFSELEKYFTSGKSNLADVMDTFFNILYQKMFTVMNSQFKFDDKYLGCVSEHMNELKPFGDVPQKLSLPLKRSFVAARVYAQSLSIVGDVVSNLINMVPSESCLEAILRMSHCSSCKGVMNAKICNNFCLNVMKGCLAFHTEVDIEWNAFVEAMFKVQQRLLGPFNIELVVEPINVKISEAIMNFQESANQVSTKVFNGCGKPPLLDNKKRRRRRQANYETRKNSRTNARTDKKHKDRDETDSNRSSVKDEKSKRKAAKDNYDLHSYKSSHIDGFLKFIQEIGEYISSTKYFWKRLPHDMCTEEINVEVNGSAVCWNGSSVGSYDRAVVLDGLKNQQFNDEVLVDVKRHSMSINEQIFTLKSVSMQLKNAYNGQDVEWIDSEEAFDPSSGSGYPDTLNNGEGSGLFEPPLVLSTNPGSASTTSTDTGLVIGTVHHRSGTDNTTVTFPDTTTSATISSAHTPKFFSSTIEVTKSTVLFSTTSRNVDVTVDGTIGITTSNRENITHTSGGTVLRCDKISLNQAIATYLLPTVIIWVGGSFNEWFHSVIDLN